MPLGDAENHFPDRSEGQPKDRAGATMIERLGPNCAIGTDGLQWIVYRRQSGSGGVAWQGEEWRAVGFIHSDKRALIACIEARAFPCRRYRPSLTPYGRLGFHSRARFCASAICSGLMSAATWSRTLTATS